MADRPLAPGLGHFLPYLLRRRLRAVLWPADSGERTAALLFLLLMVAYGLGFGLLLNSAGDEDTALARQLPHFIIGLYAVLLSSGPLVDFLPALRRVARPFPEHFPVSARLGAVTAFLLDFMTLRRLALVAGLLALPAVAPRHAAVPGLALLLLLATAVISYNVRFLVSIGRWRHPLLLAHVLSFGLLAGWVARPELPHHTALGVLLALLPWALAAGQLALLGPFFAARFLPETQAAVAPAAGSLLSRLLPEQRAYLRRTWGLLLTGLVLKVVLIALVRWTMLDGDKLTSEGYFYLALVPLVGFSYVNNNLFGYMRTLAANEMQRLGLTHRLLRLYLRLVAPVVLADCLLTAVLLLALFPPVFWPRLGIIPLGAVALGSVGLWASLYQAKEVTSSATFGNVNKNNSKLMGVVTFATAAGLYFLPWWWARVLLTAGLAASATWPIRAVLRNDGSLRRRLWHRIGA